MKSALIIFVRNPVLGKVKTRVAKDLGDEVALGVYKKLLSHTYAITEHLDVDPYVFYADYINNDDLWDSSLYKKQLQQGEELGDRMHNAFEQLFNDGYKKVCIIGSDCYELTIDIIENAFKLLETNNAVVGPSLDGGYYLLGMNTFIPQLFKNKNWSTDSVFEDTVTDLVNSNCTYSFLKELSDVDNGADCRRYSYLLSSSP